ncbi:hypothetical protein EVJ58_g10481 [Rhodofomes roseus]|uniref:Uncharacterized protein n=1 Tax=Rhodofomes roseus TaxID=34475 RepID=A0A4Y9XPE1_9APHY|nr:hypothetical protein EVJ58_g10481 [Rhodofomes roseus]
MPPILSYVIVSDYGSQYTPFPLVDLLRCLVSCKGLQHVEFANLHLDCSYNGPPLVQHGITWDAEVVDFLGMRGDVIAHYNRLLGYPYVEAVSYTRCSMEVPCMLGNSYYTRLTEIATSRALFSFLAAGRGPFSCRDVTLTNCDGLRPEVLHMLGLTTDGVWLCPYIKSLTIVGCKQFHSPALRFLLEGRRRVHEATGFPEDIDPQYVVGSIEDLDVKDCCELTPEDKAWLDANVSNVRWDDWSGGYSSRRSR